MTLIAPNDEAEALAMLAILVILWAVVDLFPHMFIRD